MKNVVFWDVAPCTSCVNRRFGGTYRDKFFRNVGSHKKSKAPHPRKRRSSIPTLFSVGSVQSAYRRSELRSKLVQGSCESNLGSR
jgi:hypothetical protein